MRVGGNSPFRCRVSAEWKGKKIGGTAAQKGGEEEEKEGAVSGNIIIARSETRNIVREERLGASSAGSIMMLILHGLVCR